MKTTKKFLCVILIVVMCLTSAPMSGFVGLEFKAEAATDYKVGDIIQFGSYPQSEVKDSATINALNDLAPAWDDWTSYGYYSGEGRYGTMVQGDWMRYTDITYNGNKYRGVKFTQYRPNFTLYASSTSNSEQYTNGYVSNTTYWFRFESINWRVLDPDTGFVVCELIMDSQPYSSTMYHDSKVDNISYAYFNDVLCTNFANDYETSSIRSWLNETFYNLAFSKNEKNKISSTLLNNDCYYRLYSTFLYKEFDSNETTDKIFLLSYEEVLENKYGFSTSKDKDITRTTQGTDYAKNQGLDVSSSLNSSASSDYDGNSCWLLRSPSDTSRYCCRVTSDGCCSGSILYTGICTGVRPAMRINLDSIDDDITDSNTEIVFDNGYEYNIYTGSALLQPENDNGISPIGLDAKLYSDTLTADDIVWTSSDESILEIIGFDGCYDSEKECYALDVDVKALKQGKAILTATASDGTSKSCTVNVKGDDFYLEVESRNLTNSIPVGETLPLSVFLYQNGNRVDVERSFALSFDNPDIFETVYSEISADREGDYLELELKAKKEGVTNLTISDSETGAYITILLTATEKMNVYYFDKLPSKEYQKGRLTNFYNYNGLCIDGFNYIKKNEYYYVDMNAYNSKHHYGVAVAYNSAGEIYDFEIIKPYKEHKTTLSENIVDLVDSFYDLGKLFGDKYYYTGDSISQYTNVYLEVPKDGYVVVTNNCGENELAYLVNMIEFTVNVALSTISASVGIAQKDELIKDLSKKIIEDLVKSGLMQTVQSCASSLSKNISYKNINDNVAEFSKAMKQLDIDIVKIVTDAINTELGVSLVESVVWNVLPTGKVVELLFAFSDACNAILHANDFGKSYNAPQIVLYPPLNNDDAYISNGVIVNPEKDISPDYVLHTYIVAENNQIATDADKVLSEVSDEYTLYNITLYKEGKEAQPDGRIKVMIPIPQVYNKNYIEVYWYKEDGSIVSMNAKVEGDYAMFYTDHLSYYALIEKKHTHSYGDKDAKCSDCGFDRTEGCGCNCHKNGIAKFFFKFLLFFQKLFKANKICKCGINHY